MTDLDLADASVAGLLAFWSLIHIPDDAVPTVSAHFHRALRPGGPLLLGFHVGDESRLKTQGYGGHPMKVHVHRRRPDQVAAWLRDAGFTVEAQMLLDLGREALRGRSSSRAVSPKGWALPARPRTRRTNAPLRSRDRRVRRPRPTDPWRGGGCRGRWF